MAETGEWPLGESARMRAVALPRAVRRRGAWRLAVLAFVLGLAAGGAAVLVLRQPHAHPDTAARTALAAARAHARALTVSLASARRERAAALAKLAAARQAKVAARAAAQKVSQQAASLASAIVANGRAADSLAAGAGSLGTEVGRLGGELKTLASYLATTPTAQLDTGYVTAQTAYLAKQLDALKAARGDLAGAIAGFESSARTLSDRAAALAK